MYLFHHKHEPSAERLEKKDTSYTIGMVLLDIVAPILLMLGVKLGTSTNASLLGNFEIVTRKSLPTAENCTPTWNCQSEMNTERLSRIF